MYFEDILDWAAVKRTLEAEQQEFHTYASRAERTHAFVLRGMEADVNTDEIICAIKEEGHQAKECYRMKGTARPLYLVTFPDTTSLNTLRKFKQILNVRVTWELRRSTRDITQCRRCQTWGHSSKNCRRRFRCSKCSGEHEITSCTSSDLKCANCSGPHRSFDSKCPVYTFKVNQARPPVQNHQRFLPAPPPARNAWSGAGRAPFTPASTSRAQQPPRTPGANFNFDRDFPATFRPRGDAPPMAAALRPAPGVARETGQFMELAGLFDELNTLANMSELMSAVKHYINLLKTCTDKVSKFQAATQFFEVDIHSFNF